MATESFTQADEAWLRQHQHRKILDSRTRIIGVAARSSSEPAHPTVLKLYPLRETCIDDAHADSRTSIRAHKWESSAPVPWPNLYWLVCPQLTRRVGRLEHLGFVRAFQRQLRSSEGLLAQFAVHQQEYRSARWECLDERDRAYVEARPGFVETLRDGGIGGLRFEQQVKCLHLHYSHYLATGRNLIGEWVQQALDSGKDAEAGAIESATHSTVAEASSRQGDMGATAKEGTSNRCFDRRSLGKILSCCSVRNCFDAVG